MHSRSVIGTRENRKTQTRRIVKPQPFDDPHGHGVQWWGGKKLQRAGYGAEYVHTDADQVARIIEKFCPYGKPGDLLLIAEAWRTEARYDHLKPSEIPDTARIHYEADGPAPDWAGRYRNQRFMCNWMVRLRRVVKDIRVERVQDISDEDCLAEGLESRDEWDAFGQDCQDYYKISDDEWCTDPKYAFERLWNDTNGAGAWDRNDMVWVIEYEPEASA